MQRVPNTFDRMFYYFSADEESCPIVLGLETSFTVDPAILKNALNTALKRNGAFRPAIFINSEGQVIYIDNEREADVYPYEGDEPENFGTDAMNGYLFRVMYEKNKIIISMYHALSDGRGLLQFARTILYYYITLSGYPVQPERHIMTLETPVDATEMADPAELYDNIINLNQDVTPEFKLKDFKMFVLPGDFYGLNEPMHTRRFRYTLDTCDLKRMAHESKSTVLSVLSSITAGVTDEIYHDEINDGELITLFEVVDLKPHYNNKSLSNFADVFPVPFTKSVLKLDTLSMAHVIRRAIAEPQLERKHLDYALSQAVKVRRGLIGVPVNNPDEMSKYRGGFFYNKEYIGTFCYSNIGRTLIDGSMAKYVLSAEMFIPAVVRHPFFTVLSHGGKTVINLTQRLKNDIFARGLFSAFRKNNINASFADCGTFTGDRLFLEKIKRI